MRILLLLEVFLVCAGWYFDQLAAHIGRLILYFGEQQGTSGVGTVDEFALTLLCQFFLEI